jgi:hypothetical protein
MEVLVPVPVEHLPAVLQIIDSDLELPAGAGTSAMAELDLTQTADVAMSGRAGFDVKRVVSHVWQRTTEAGRAVLTATAEASPDRVTLAELEHTTGVNVGAANLSIASHLQTAGDDLHLRDLMGLKVVGGLSTYCMTGEVAEAVLELARQ